MLKEVWNVCWFYVQSHVMVKPELSNAVVTDYCSKYCCWYDLEVSTRWKCILFSDLFQNLNQKHNDELNEVTKGLKLEISLLKQPHDSKFSRSSVHQLKQDMCMEYTSTLKVRLLRFLKVKNQP
jgi:hypothetical protein